MCAYRYTTRAPTFPPPLLPAPCRPPHADRFFPFLATFSSLSKERMDAAYTELVKVGAVPGLGRPGQGDGVSSAHPHAITA